MHSSSRFLSCHSQLFNEIMPTIYGRFTEKEARQWRQIYKALVLLELVLSPPPPRHWS